MAELGQIIVNRVKPLLDTANSAGYETGYGNGFDSGYVSGEESVREYVDTQVEISKKAIIGRGGNISSEAGLEDLPQAIFNIPADASLAHYTDEGIAYRKNVPAGAEKYALLKSVGGMTYKCKNLFPILQWANRTIGGITFRLDENGVYHLSGTATETLFTVLKLNLPIGKYTLSLNCNKQIGTGYVNAVYVTGRSADGDWKISHSTHFSNTYTTITTTVDMVDVTFAIMEGVNCDGLTIAPMINEGDYIPYEPYYEGLRNSKTTEVKSDRANGELISSRPIPKALQDIDGFGWGINADCYNYVDYENKQFVKRVGVAVFDGSADELWVATSALNMTDYNAFYIRQYATNSHKTSGGEAICDKLSILTTSELYYSNIGGFYMGNVTDKQIAIRVPNSIADVSALRTWLSQNPLMFYYELTEPIITDISDILTDDNFIEVESGGSLEFVNEYKYAVPSMLKYTIKVGS